MANPDDSGEPPPVPGEGVVTAGATIRSPAQSTTTRGYYSPGNTSATLDVKVPADARVWVAGQETKQTGSERWFSSPPLTPGKSFAYEVKAEWMENGKKVEQTRNVTVEAGKESLVDFREPSR